MCFHGRVGIDDNSDEHSSSDTEQLSDDYGEVNEPGMRENDDLGDSLRDVEATRERTTSPIAAGCSGTIYNANVFATVVPEVSEYVPEEDQNESKVCDF